MNTKKLIATVICAFTFMIALVAYNGDTIIKNKANIETNSKIERSSKHSINNIITKSDTIPRIIKGGSIEMIKGRRGYDLAGREISTKHFAVRVTTPDNPFKPHKHEQSELWFIVKGKAKVKLNGIEYEVEENDLIILDPWVEHGLSTTSEVTWICLG